MNQHEFNTLLISFVQEEDVLYRSANLNFTNSGMFFKCFIQLYSALFLGERHLAYERIAEKLRAHGASFVSYCCFLTI